MNQPTTKELRAVCVHAENKTTDPTVALLAGALKFALNRLEQLESDFADAKQQASALVSMLRPAPAPETAPAAPPASGATEPTATTKPRPGKKTAHDSSK